jgi:hypothetical protein
VQAQPGRQPLQARKVGPFADDQVSQAGNGLRDRRERLQHAIHALVGIQPGYGEEQTLPTGPVAHLVARAHRRLLEDRRVDTVVNDDHATLVRTGLLEHAPGGVAAHRKHLFGLLEHASLEPARQDGAHAVA